MHMQSCIVCVVCVCRCVGVSVCVFIKLVYYFPHMVTVSKREIVAPHFHSSEAVE